ncbi:ThiF family adenylyltransferase [Kytococcus sp. Marseille-QA3725]
MSTVPSPGLDAAASRRHVRQLALPEVGASGQARLAAGRVLVLGAGGLGSPALLYLAAAGVGHLTVVDDDTVELSNLHRQVLHGQGDVGRPKVESAADALARLDPGVRVSTVAARLTEQNGPDLVAGHDLVLDGSDSFATRDAVDAACARVGIPHVWGAVSGTSGQASTFDARAGWRYRDLYPPADTVRGAPSCSRGGVLGPVCALTASVMATEAVKLLVGGGEPLLGRLLVVDAWSMRFTTYRLPREDPREPTPEAGGPTGAHGSTDEDERAAAPGPARGCSPAALQEALAAGTAPTLVDLREPQERTTGTLPGALCLPWEEVLRGDHDELVQDAVLYCASGARSGLARDAVSTRGGRVDHLAGGWRAWSAEVPDASG